MKFVTLDFEMYSELDLKKHGLSRYLNHPSTEVQMLSWAPDADETKRLWVPFPGCVEIMPDELRLAIEAECEFRAHEAQMEILVWRKFMVEKFGWPEIPSRLWRCTAAKCAYGALPRSLGRVSSILDLEEDGKDTEGHKLMLKLCKPQKEKRRHNVQEFLRLCDYCKQDVTAEEHVHDLTPLFPPRELNIWRLDQKINNRGCPVDMALALGAAQIIDRASEIAEQRLAEITKDPATGESLITTTGQLQRMTAFVRARGVYLDNMKYDTLDAAIKSGDIVDEAALEVLTIRRDTSAAAVKKMRAIADWADADGYCRGTLKYYAAGPGRWGGRGPQLQNLFKGEALTDEIKVEAKRVGKLPKDEQDWTHYWRLIEAALAVIASGDYEAAQAIARDGDVFALVANAVRLCVRAATGRKFGISDFAGIECRVLHWLVGDEPMLELFRNGGDVYVGMACAIFECERDAILDPATGKVWDGNPEAKLKRDVGKVTQLGCGFQMAGERLQENALDKAGLVLELEFCEAAVAAYRAKNPLVASFWRDVDDAAVWCVRNNSEQPIQCGKVSFRMDGKWLVLRLPSGRDLYFFNARIARGKFGQPCVAYDSHKGRVDLYGGLLTENIVQSIARDLLCDAMIRVDREGGEIVLHVHDEIVIECDAADNESSKMLHRCMETVEPWAAGCPVAAETHESVRYTK